ncbi:MAG TPA: hypothetical protein VLA41_05625 [Burkholderiales bacterium]|nr:hypothetical protein [Burkholderiales bacterium]
MRDPKTAALGRGPTEEVESGWLGAEALPGSSALAHEDAQGELDLTPSEARGAGAWIAAVLSWARRRHFS